MSSRNSCFDTSFDPAQIPAGPCAPVWIWEVRSRLFVTGAPIHAKNLFCAQCPPVNAHSSRSSLTEFRIDTIDIVKGLSNHFFPMTSGCQPRDRSTDINCDNDPLNFYPLSCLLFLLSCVVFLSFFSLSLSLSLSVSYSFESNDTHDIYIYTVKLSLYRSNKRLDKLRFISWKNQFQFLQSNSDSCSRSYKLQCKYALAFLRTFS